MIKDISVLKNCVIEFKKPIEETGSDFDCGMKACIVSVDLLLYNFVRVSFDFSKFEEENKLLMQNNYFTGVGNKYKRWDEMDFYRSLNINKN